MARRRAIEADELFETANRLQAEGKDVTAVALLDALGGGSLRTIYKHLETWQQRRPSVTVPTNEEIPGSVQVAFANAWRLATQEAGRQVIAVKEKAAEEVAAANKQFQDALDVVGKLESESEADAQQIEDLKAKIVELEVTLQKSQTESATHGATAEQLNHQVKSQESELERLRKEIDKERSERDTAIKEASELRGFSDGLKTQNAELLSKLGRK
jgi:thioesterase domain-containing protein